MSQNVFVVTVTYNKRWHLLSLLLDSVSNMEQVKKVIVVDNGSDEDLPQKLSEYKAVRTKLVALNTNSGSAKGFKSGIQAAIDESDCDYVWLMDDDNVPRADALEILLDSYDKLIASNQPNKLALLSYRRDRIQYQETVRGAKLQHWFAQPDSFVGFHVSKVPAKLLRRILPSRGSGPRGLREYIEIPYGPYGGLFFQPSLIGSIGLPDESFYLYGDDSEFTDRIRHCGGKLYLVPASEVVDISTSWAESSETQSVNFFNRVVLGSDEQVYYGVRNSAYVSRRSYRRNALVFMLNRWIYTYSIACYLRLTGRRERLALFQRAIADAENGKLGQLSHE